MVVYTYVEMKLMGCYTLFIYKKEKVGYGDKEGKTTNYPYIKYWRREIAADNIISQEEEICNT
jgi:hypothetical protein